MYIQKKISIFLILVSLSFPFGLGASLSDIKFTVTAASLYLPGPCLIATGINQKRVAHMVKDLEMTGQMLGGDLKEILLKRAKTNIRYGAVLSLPWLVSLLADATKENTSNKEELTSKEKEDSK